MRKGSGLQRSEKFLVSKDSTNTLLDGSGGCLLVAEGLFVLRAPVVRIQVFQLLFLGVQLRGEGFLGLCRGRRNSHEQEKEKSSESHKRITSQDANSGRVVSSWSAYGREPAARIIIR